MIYLYDLYVYMINRTLFVEILLVIPDWSLPASAGSDICFSRITSRHRQGTHFPREVCRFPLATGWFLSDVAHVGLNLGYSIPSDLSFYHFMFPAIKSAISHGNPPYFSWFNQDFTIVSRAFMVLNMVAMSCTGFYPTSRSMCSRTTSARSWSSGTTTLFFFRWVWKIGVFHVFFHVFFSIGC